MFLFLLGLFAGGSFLISGIGILFDSRCDTVSFSMSSRIVSTTCFEDGAYMVGSLPGWVGGLGSIIVGVVIILIGLGALARD
jgi:hypothetical protein